MPPTTPKYMATPPILGIGTTWTSRLRGMATAFTLMAKRRTTAVSRKVNAAETRPTSRYSRIGRPAGTAEFTTASPSETDTDETRDDHSEQRYRYRSRSLCPADLHTEDRKSTRLNSSHVKISYAVFC